MKYINSLQWTQLGPDVLTVYCGHSFHQFTVNNTAWMRCFYSLNWTQHGQDVLIVYSEHGLDKMFGWFTMNIFWMRCFYTVYSEHVLDEMFLPFTMNSLDKMFNSLQWTQLGKNVLSKGDVGLVVCTERCVIFSFSVVMYVDIQNSRWVSFDTAIFTSRCCGISELKSAGDHG